jgi:hypothetical protein
VALVIGQSYNLKFTTLNTEIGTSGTYCVNDNGVDAYPGGVFLVAGGSLVANDDLAFRVLGVPEPSTQTLLAVGLSVFAAHRRRPTSHNRV